MKKKLEKIFSDVEKSILNKPYFERSTVHRYYYDCKRDDKKQLLIMATFNISLHIDYVNKKITKPSSPLKKDYCEFYCKLYWSVRRTLHQVIPSKAAKEIGSPVTIDSGHFHISHTNWKENGNYNEIGGHIKVTNEANIHSTHKTNIFNDVYKPNPIKTPPKGRPSIEKDINKYLLKKLDHFTGIKKEYWNSERTKPKDA